MPPVPLNTVWSVRQVIECSILPVVATCAVIGRFTSRRLKGISPGVDDWLILIALIVFYGHCTIGILAAVLGGLGHHIDTLTPGAVIYAGKLLVAVQIAYAVVLGLVKSSLCILLLRIFYVQRYKRIIRKRGRRQMLRRRLS